MLSLLNLASASYHAAVIMDEASPAAPAPRPTAIRANRYAALKAAPVPGFSPKRPALYGHARFDRFAPKLAYAA